VIVTPGGNAVLTDFELAKLFDGSPSVSRDWPDDPYRAPEVEGGRFDHRADLYSWARVLVRGLLDTLPAAGEDARRLDAQPLPARVRAAVRSCLAVHPDDRPGSAAAALPTVKDWK
jgi:serine/threonine protein kinase